MIDLSLRTYVVSYVFRVHCDLDHILALVIVVLGGYDWPLHCLLFICM